MLREAIVGRRADPVSIRREGRRAALDVECVRRSRRIVAPLFAIALAACSSEDAGRSPQPVAACTELPCLAPPERGLQLRSVGAEVAPGTDVELCEVVQLPGDASETYYVDRLEAAMTEGSHHLIVSAVEPGSPTEKGLDPGYRRPCITAEQLGSDLLPVTGSQKPYREETFPPGVGRVYHGGQLVIFDYHYLNTTTKPIAARAAVNFHTVDASAVKKVARSFGFYNFSIDTPPGQTESFDQTCTFTHDIVVHQLTRHTHRWGRDFTVWYAGGPHDGDVVLESESYEDTDFPFDEPLLLSAGEGFKFRCTFQNTEAYPLEFGVKATDEMCILFGTWWEADDAKAPKQGCTKF